MNDRQWWAHSTGNQNKLGGAVPGAKFANVFDQGGPASKCTQCGKVVYTAKQMMEHTCKPEPAK